MRQTGRSAGRILIPNGRSQTMTVLTSYTEQEQSRPEAERFTLPAFSDMLAVRDELTLHLGTRKEHLRLRKQATARRLSVSSETRKVLKEAAAYLVVTQCGGKICRDLETWGFRIVMRGSSAPKVVEPEEVVA